MVKSVSISDAQYRFGVSATGAALVVWICAVRFCGSMSLPVKPPPPASLATPASHLAAEAASTAAAYDDFLARDAYAAGLRTPTREAMARKLPYRVEEARHVLEIGDPPVVQAGLELRALHVAEGLALEIVNTTGSDIAYDVATQPIDGANCDTAPAIPFNAMTIAAGHRETRLECAWRDGISLAVTRIETLEVPALGTWYLNHVAPAAVGIEPRIGRGHHPEIGAPCVLAMPQAVRSGLERGEIGWRDLTDFYSRHRCQTYRFPLMYRAFKSDGERSLPATVSSM